MRRKLRSENSDDDVVLRVPSFSTLNIIFCINKNPCFFGRTPIDWKQESSRVNQ